MEMPLYHPFKCFDKSGELYVRAKVECNADTRVHMVNFLPNISGYNLF